MQPGLGAREAHGLLCASCGDAVAVAQLVVVDDEVLHRQVGDAGEPVGAGPEIVHRLVGQGAEQRAADDALRRHSHRDDGDGDARRREADREPGGGASAAERHIDRRGVSARELGQELVRQLEAGLDVAERAGRVRAPDRDDEDPLAGEAELGDQHGHRRGHQRIGAHRVQLRACVQHGARVVLRVVAAGLARHQRVHLEALRAAIERGREHVVRAHGAERHQRVGPHLACLSEEVFEFPYLVAAIPGAGAIVALDPDLGAERVAQPGHGLERRRDVGERDLRQRA